MAALGTNTLTLVIDGVERAAEVSKAVFQNAETSAGFVSFADAAAGGSRDWMLMLIATQDPGDTDSLLSLVMDHAGDDVDVTVRPYGNAVPSDTQPHYTATCTVKLPDGDTIGGEADASSAQRFTVEMKWDCLAKPVRVTGGTSPTITAVSPATGARSTVVPVTITGTGFDPSPTITVSGTLVTVSGVSRPNSTLIYAQLTVAAGAATTARGITVTNADATTVTASAAFTVT